MKAYLYSIPKLIKNVSQSLDAQSILCDKSWVLFNDAGVKQLFIFQKDGTLLVVTNGVVTESSWKYLPVNNSIIIKTGEESMMFHPAFIDDAVFALQQDGDQSCLFMIDEKNKFSFLPQSFTELEQYFFPKEKTAIEPITPNTVSAVDTILNQVETTSTCNSDVDKVDNILPYETDLENENNEWDTRIKASERVKKAKKEKNNFFGLGIITSTIGLGTLLFQYYIIGGFLLLIGVAFIASGYDIDPESVEK